jgi:hypothetical protein
MKKRALALVVAVSSVVLGAGVLAPSPASARPASCPEVTDSIERLYQAYFLRASDDTGLDFWIAQYTTGLRNLANISDWFAQSPEFINRYGALDNTQFVRQIYLNVLGRDPDPAGLWYWVGRLNDRSLTRGTVLVNFSESAEFVSRTETWPPLSGYLNYYPPGTTFYCGYGPEVLELVKLRTGPMQADVLGMDQSDAAWGGIVQARGSAMQPNGVIFGDVMNPHSYAYHFNMPFDTQRGQQSVWLDVSGFQDAYWTIAVHPAGMPNDRAGWNT